MGPKPEPEFTIKLNNELLEHQRSMNSLDQSPRGSPRSPLKNVVTGKTVKNTEKQQEAQNAHEKSKDQRNFSFTAHKPLHLGPGEYDAQFTQTKNRCLTTSISPHEPTKTMEEVINKQIADDMKMIRKFDGSCATFKKTYPSPKVAHISERM